MAIEVKVTPVGQSVSTGATQTVTEAITAPPGSNITLNIARDAIASYTKDGADLVVQLKNGETLRIADFYADPQKPSQLLLTEGDQLVSADLGTVASDGAITAAYVPHAIPAGFGAGAGAAAAAGGVSTAMLAGLGGLAAIGGIAAAASSGGSDDPSRDDPAPPPPPSADTTPPAAASGLQINAQGDRLTGTAEAGARVNVDTNGDGQADQTATVGADGNFEVALDPPLTNGETVTVVVTDPAGNNSPSATVDAPDSTAPQPATDVVISPDGTSVGGNAEPGSTVGVDTNGDGEPDQTVVVGEDGGFEIPLDPPLTNGETVTVIVTDPAGNESPPTTVTAPDNTAPQPATDLAIAPDGTSVSGTAEPGSTVGVDTNGDGEPDQTVVVGEDGGFEAPLDPPLTNGETVTVIVTDPAGNESPPATVIAPDSTTAPAAPTIEPSNGIELAGTASIGTTVVLTDGDGNPIGEATVDTDGNWSFTPSTQLPDGTTVNAVATNSDGEASPPATITIDGVAPTAPVVDPSNGVELSGTAEPGSTVTLTDGDGNPIGEITADGDGNWSFTPPVPLPDGMVIEAVAQDAAGNTSPSGSVTVDAVAPGQPVINPSNGTELSGTAEPGSIVTLTDGDGNPIGQVTTDGDGNWSFTPTTPFTDDTVINAVASDPSGNVSLPASITVDTSLPSVPVIDPSNGTVISGTADPSNTVILTDGDGNPIGQVTADGSGNWSFTPGTPLLDGTTVQVVARNPTGTDSAPASVVVDGVAPAAPTVDPSNGAEFSGTAEPGSTVTLTDGDGNPIGETTADGDGNWAFTPTAPLPDGTVVEAVARDAAGNPSPSGSVTVDAVAPGQPVINPSNGAELSGTAEPGSIVTLTDGDGNPIGEVTADGDGNWSFTPPAPLPDGTAIEAIASDASGNASGPATTTIDGAAPAAPTNLAVTPDGSSLTGTAEPNSVIQVVVGDDTANPITLQADGEGNFTIPLAPPLTAGEELSVTAADAAGNVSDPGTVLAPDSTPPTVTVVEADDGFINGAEVADGIQVAVELRPGTQVGDTINVSFTGQNGYQVTVPYTVSEADRAAGIATVALTPPDGMADFPEGESSVTVDINGGTPTDAVSFTVDTIPPDAPVLSLVGNLLTISTEPFTELNVQANIAGVTVDVPITADNTGLASLDLLSGLGASFSWDQLLSANVNVTGSDLAGNPSPVASIGIGSAVGNNIVSLGDLGVALNLLPPTLGVSGNTAPNGEVALVVTALGAEVSLSTTADANGDFTFNLLTILGDLGLDLGSLLGGPLLGLNFIVTNENGVESARYGMTLGGGSLLDFGFGNFTVDGTETGNLLSGDDTRAETFSALGGDDLILSVGSDDTVDAGAGNDLIEVNASDFVAIDGGDGFDILLLTDGIDLDYNAAGVGTLANIERINMGEGDTGSTLTLTDTEVDAITDDNNVLQITGEANDTLNVIGAVDTGTTQEIDGISYNVYTFGSSTLLVEDDTVQVIAA